MRTELERRGVPRLQMMLIVALTGGAGFLISYALLHIGVDSLAWRYGLSVAIAYLPFLFLLWLWMRTSPSDYDGLDDVIADAIDAKPSRSTSSPVQFEGAGGHFGGGGASGDWDPSCSADPILEMPQLPEIGSAGDVLDAEEAAIPLGIALVLLSLLVLLLFACVSIIYSAPTLFAELLVDGVLSASLYQHLRRIRSRHWLSSAVRRTALPFFVTAFLLVCAGLLMAHYVPHARTLSEVLVAF
jgi:hypothetical protein